jgi:heme-degrading monooxygenase HmoA
MYLRIAWGRVEPGRWNDYVAAYKEGAAALTGQRGLKGRALLRDVDDADAGYSLTWWDSSEAMAAYEDDANREILPRIQAYFPAAFVINRLEVVDEQTYD